MVKTLVLQLTQREKTAFEVVHILVQNKITRFKHFYKI